MPVDNSLHATAQLLTFQPGLYSVDFATARSSPTDTGLRLPCVRLESIPPAPANPGRAFVSILAEGGWLSQGSEPSFVRVVGGRAGVMLTIYKAGLDMPAPELRIRLLPEIGRRAPPVAPAAQGPAPAAGNFIQMVHVQGRGDVRALAGEWIGQAGSGVPVEGFSLTPAEGAGADDPARSLEYQAILGDQWNTPWMRAGQFCGSRGMALPILGVRVRLAGAAAEGHECQCWGSFVGSPNPRGPVRDGEACSADGAFLEALRVAVVSRVKEAEAPTPKPGRMSHRRKAGEEKAAAPDVTTARSERPGPGAAVAPEATGTRPRRKAPVPTPR